MPSDAFDTSPRLFRFRFPALPSFLPSLSSTGVYIAGALFALGFWAFIDAAVYSKVASGGEVHVTFVDWIPGICSVLGMIVINSIDKARLNGDSFSYSGSGVAWKARLFLFVGFALMAGGLAGSITVLTLKYLLPNYPYPTLWFGVANVLANGLIMLSSALLWLVQNADDKDYQYNLTI
ncbi:Vacuolar protein sorting-associated protein 68 [Saitoella coloradoensis]